MVQQLDTCSLFNKLSEICLALIVNESLEIFAIIFINGNQFCFVFFFLTSSATSCSDVYNYVFILHVSHSNFYLHRHSLVAFKICIETCHFYAIFYEKK